MRTFVIQHPAEVDIDGNLTPLGSRSEVLEQLFNRSVGPEKPGDNLLYGPGIQIEMAPDEDPINQMTLTYVDPDIADGVVWKLKQELNWQLTDMITGQTF